MAPETNGFTNADLDMLAEAFHTSYEALAPHYGYKTREASAVPWEDVPEDNKALMRGVMLRLLASGRITVGRSGWRPRRMSTWRGSSGCSERSNGCSGMMGYPLRWPDLWYTVGTDKESPRTARTAGARHQEEPLMQSQRSDQPHNTLAHTEADESPDERAHGERPDGDSHWATVVIDDAFEPRELTEAESVLLYESGIGIDVERMWIRPGVRKGPTATNEDTGEVTPYGEALRLLALEVRRINAEGGKRGKDELARELYNEASPMHDWDNMKPWGGLGVEERKEEWRRVAEHVDGMMDDLFPSLAACEAADLVLAELPFEQQRAFAHVEVLAELREQDREDAEASWPHHG